MNATATTIHQVRRPQGAPVPEDFAFVTGPVPETAPGTALVENLYLSVDPYMREEMDGGWRLGTPLEGRAVGRVLASRAPELPEGALVFHRESWRTHALVTPETAHVLPGWPGVPIRTRLTVLGGTGLTAYVGLVKVARLAPGEDVFITSAAGGVGTAAGQIARLLGAGRIVGSAGSPAKTRRLVEELGFDAAFDHHDGPVGEQLAAAAPGGVDVVVENVGGAHLEGAIAGLRPHGRIAWAGAIGQYNDLGAPPPAPRNLYDLVGKGARLEGFLVRDHQHVRTELEAFLVPHLRSGALVPAETVTDGIGNMPGAFIAMLAGGAVGKALVRVGEE